MMDSVEDLEKSFGVDLVELLEEQWGHFPEDGEELLDEMVPPEEAVYFVVGPHCFGKGSTPQKAWQNCKEHWPSHIDTGEIRVYYARHDCFVTDMGQTCYWDREEVEDDDWKGRLGVRLMVCEDIDPDNFGLTDTYPTTGYTEFDPDEGDDFEAVTI